ncbi:MAG TPA: TonB family protein [Sphingomicrobium sp.]|nr:TonB family protein [Sphingomicrobium sp.]
MSYAQRKELSGNRTMSKFFTVVVVSGLMYAIVTGLAYNVIKKTAQDLKTFNVEEQPPPPEPPPPPPKDMPKVPPPPMQPPPLVRTNLAPPPIQTVVAPVIPAPPPPIVAPPPPKPPPPPRQAEPKSLVGSLQGLISADDYPASSLDNNEQGTVSVTLTVGPSGRVTGCSIGSSSASSTLNNATCRLLSARARFSPAQDGNGNPVTSTTSARITWRIAE